MLYSTCVFHTALLPGDIEDAVQKFKIVLLDKIKVEENVNWFKSVKIRLNLKGQEKSLGNLLPPCGRAIVFV
jgi:hypothetical protein